MASQDMSPICQQFDVLPFLEGQADADFEAHLSDCQVCQQRLDDASAPVEFRQSLPQHLSDPALMLDERPGADTSYRSGGNNALGDDSAERSGPDLLKWWLAPSNDHRFLGRVAQYGIVQVIGRGGMGLVLEAIDLELERTVAVKTILQPLAIDGAGRARLLREAAAAASLKHPHIIPIYSIQQWRDVPYMVMPLVRGGTLFHKRPANSRFRPEQIAQVGQQVSSALAAAHQQGVIHRDIKPTNILLDDDLNHVVLTDFGLARSGEDATLTLSGTVAGTPSFMAPEQALGKDIDARSDLFSMGCVLYWMATGASPFQADSCYDSFRKLMDQQPEPIERQDPQFPRALSQLISELLHKSPDRRIESAQEANDLLNQLVAHWENPLTCRLPGRLQRPFPWRLVGFTLTSLTVLLGGMMVGSQFFSSQKLDRATETASVGSTLGISNSVNPWAESESLENPSGSTLESKESHSPESPFTLVPDPPPAAEPLDALDRQNVMQDLAVQRNVKYWLRRLACLPIHEVPVEVMPQIEPYLVDLDPSIRELANVTLNKNPFQEIGSDE